MTCRTVNPEGTPGITYEDGREDGERSNEVREELKEETLEHVRGVAWQEEWEEDEREVEAGGEKVDGEEVDEEPVMEWKWLTELLRSLSNSSQSIFGLHHIKMEKFFTNPFLIN